MEFPELIVCPMVDGVVLHTSLKPSYVGTLNISGHHIIVSSRKEDVEELMLLRENIDQIDKKVSNTGGGTLVLKCKDFRIISLDVSNTEDFNGIALSLERLMSLHDPIHKYAFYFRPMYTILEDGWSMFSLETEFSKLLQSDEWRVTNVNSDFLVCPSYPKTLIVPKTIDDATVIGSAKFRENGRFPIISFKHDNGAILARSSQPLTGANNKRSREDERLLNSMLTNGKRGFIVDTRSMTSAHAAKAKGGGYELEMHYPQWKRVHNAVDRRQCLLDSLTKFVEACNDTNCSMDKWLSRVDSSNWMTHVKDLLNCACLVAQFLDQESASVLIHGTEGLDSSLIVCTLTQVILNPDCRTLRGLEAVIDREWVQAGHPFGLRNAHSIYYNATFKSKEVAPSFLLFLTCLSQIHFQFPCSFEFSPLFLIWLFEHSYASQFGTFLCNSEMEREKLALRKCTISMWSHINRPDILESILNPMYDPNNSVIWPSVAPMSLTFWPELFHRWSVPQKAEADAWKMISKIIANEKDLRAQASRLRRQLQELEQEAEAAGLLEPGSDHPTSLEDTT